MPATENLGEKVEEMMKSWFRNLGNSKILEKMGCSKHIIGKNT